MSGPADLIQMCPETWVWPEDIPLEEWGRRGWRWLHITAINYSQFPNLDESRIVYRRLWNFIRKLPCKNCCSHGMDYLIKNPPDLASSESLQRWMWTFHNDVNVRLKKKAFTYEEYRGAYADEICWSQSAGGTCPLADASLKKGLGEWSSRRESSHRRIALPVVRRAS